MSPSKRLAQLQALAWIMPIYLNTKEAYRLNELVFKRYQDTFDGIIELVEETLPCVFVLLYNPATTPKEMISCISDNARRCGGHTAHEVEHGAMLCGQAIKTVRAHWFTGLLRHDKLLMVSF